MADRSSISGFEMNLETGTASSPRNVSNNSPFRMLILGDVTGRASRGECDVDRLSKRRLTAIDRDNFDDVLKSLQPKLELRIGSDQTEPTTIAFQELDDFHPDQLFERVELFEHLRRLRRRLKNKDLFDEAAAELMEGNIADVPAAESKAPPPPQAPEIPTEGLLDAAMEVTETAARKAAAVNPIERLIQEIVAPYIEPTADPRVDEFVAAVDQAIGDLMRRLLHHPEFQALEAAWRGLYLLVRRLETDSKLRLQLLDVSVDEIAADLEHCDTASESGLGKLLADQSIGTPGSEPFACLVGLFEVGATESDIAAMTGLSAIARQLGSPILAGANSRLVGCPTFGGSPDPADWNTELDESTGQKWRQFRTTVGKFASLLAPRFLLRNPYGKKTDAIESFAFEELPASPEHDDYLWGHAAILGALLLGTGFTEQGWSLRTEASMELDGLPVHVFGEEGDKEQKPCAEAWLTERSGSVLVENGLTPAFSIRNKDAVLLPGLRNAAMPSGPLNGRWG